MRIRADQFVPKRQGENQIIAYHDINRIEFYYHNQGSKAVEIRVELIIDGPYEVARAVVQPGEIVTVIETTSGEPYQYFVSDVYGGDILVFDLASGELVDRKTSLEFRLYDSHLDSYDTLVSPSGEREVFLDEEEHRLPNHSIRVNLKTEEILIGLHGLHAEWREIDSYVYASINGEEVLIAKATRLPPRSITFYLYMEPGVARMLAVGEANLNAHVESYYSDTGEYYNSISAEIYEVVCTD